LQHLPPKTTERKKSGIATKEEHAGGLTKVGGGKNRSIAAIEIAKRVKKREKKKARTERKRNR